MQLRSAVLVLVLGACGSARPGAQEDGSSTTTSQPQGEDSANSSGSTTSGEPGDAAADSTSSGIPSSTSENSSTHGDSGEASTSSTGEPGSDATTTADASRKPSIPSVQGPCPDFSTAGGLETPASLTFPAGPETREALVYFDPQSGGGGPLVFFFHGAGGSPQQAVATVTSSAIEQVLGEGGMVVAPVADPAAQYTWFIVPTIDPTEDDIVLMDSIVACADAGPGIDPYRIHGVGFSAGALHLAQASIRRSSYMASIVSYSGGLRYERVPHDNVDAVPSVLAFHGGPTDEVSAVAFDQASITYADFVRSREAYALLCNHQNGHGYPDNVEGVWRRADAYNFLVDHPFGTEPLPYLPDVPAWVPDYCTDG